MDEAPIPNGPATVPAPFEPVVIEERPFRHWAIVTALTLTTCSVSFVVGQWRGGSPKWTNIVAVFVGVTAAAILTEVVRRLLDMRVRVVVRDGCVSGPGRFGPVRIRLDRLDRARLAADAARRWRCAFGLDLRTRYGERIRVDALRFSRDDRELLLRALSAAQGATRT